MTLKEAIEKVEKSMKFPYLCATEHIELRKWYDMLTKVQSQLGKSRTILPRPAVRNDDGKRIKSYWSSDLNTALQEKVYVAARSMDEWHNLDTEDGVYYPEVETAKEEFAEAVADIISLCISVLEVNGFDEEKRNRLFAAVNKKNERCGCFDERD